MCVCVSLCPILHFELIDLESGYITKTLESPTILYPVETHLQNQFELFSALLFETNLFDQ